MSDKDIHVKLDELLSANPDLSPSERVIHLQDVGNCLPKSYVDGLEQKLYNVLKVYLHSKNFEIQKCALNLLHTCLINQNLTTLPDALSLNLAFAVIFMCNSGKDDLPEYQELWLKGFDTLQLMSELHPVLCKNHGTRILSVFQKALSVCYTSNVQKSKALQMLDKYISSVDIQNIKELLYHLCSEQLFPLAFTKYKESYHGLCLQVIYRLLPGVQQVLIKYPEEWEKIVADIRNKYVPEIERLIKENDCVFAKLWIFLVKLIGSKFHKGSPVVNSLLSCIEGAFKVANLEVRRQSFFCWQVLIESYTMESHESFTEKRIKLLTIPLKTNNGKTEELVKVKIYVWCKLLEILKKHNLISSFGVLDEYLAFCFGPFCNSSLLYGHGLVSQGKKYPSVHLKTCKSLLQLIGNPKYIDKQLQSKLTVLKIKVPVLNTLEFIELSKNIIDSVAESCVMLSQLETSDRSAINEALWKSLFYIIDTLDNEKAKTKTIGEISGAIIFLINVARKKANVINFGLKPLFNIITSNEFGFCQEEQFANELFIPMIEVIIKRDKILLHDDVVWILKSVFVFKRNSEQYLQFVHNSQKLFSKENSANPEKINALRSIWYIIEEELLFFDKLKINLDEKLFLKVFYDVLNWPIVILKSAKSTEKIDLKWKELYSFFGKTTCGLLQSKLSSLLMYSIYQIVKMTPNNITIAEYAYYIISNLILDNCDKGTCEEIAQIYSNIKTILSIPSLSPEIVNIYESCVSHMLDTTAKLPKLHYLLPSINGCLTSLLDIYAKTDILRSAALFLDQIDKNDDRLKPELETLTKILDKHKTTTDKQITLVEVDANIDKCDKEQTLTLLGHDINTMTPVKLKGSMLKIVGEKQSPSTDLTPRKNKSDVNESNSELVFVHSPYKFDPKKLTKQQRERLSRRRDDIPALYQDLTQSSSQLIDLNSSNSESLLEQLKPKLDQQPTQTKESITTVNKTENNAHGENTIKESNESSHSEDIIQSDSEPMEKNTRLKRQRKTLNLSSKIEAETSTTSEKKKRGRKRKYAIETVNKNPNDISKENMDVNKIPPEPEDMLKLTRRRRSSQLQHSHLKHLAQTIESVIENESSSSDAFLSTPENSLQSTSDATDNLPIKLKIINKNNKLKSKAVAPNEGVEGKNINLEEDSSDTTDNKLNSKTTDDDGQETSSMSDDGCLINLEANTELNKLENKPYLGRPAKILRGTRRVSEGNHTKKPTLEKNIIDYANLFVLTNNDNISDDKVKKKMIRELKNIQIDIKNSDEYIKTNGRKTRLSQQTEKEVRRTRRSKQLNKSSNENMEKIQAEPSESEESDFIESSQENEKAMNIKECDVRDVYSLEKNTSGLLLQESESNNRPKISPIKINIKSNKLVKSGSPKTKSEYGDEKSTSDDTNVDKTPDIIKETEQPSEDQTLIMDKLASQNVSLATETESAPTQSQSDNPVEDICAKRRVILSNSVISTEEETPSTPPKSPNTNNIPTSPVSNDTPTRTKELLEDTLEISPIKKVPSKSANLDDDVPVAADMENPPDDNESPELFESETVSSVSQKTDDAEKVFGNSSQYSSRMLRKNKSRVLSGRSAKMMKMISAKQTFVPTASTKTSTVNKMDPYCSPSSNRTKKMMINLEKCDIIPDTEAPLTPSNQASNNTEPLINQDDVLCIGKELPSPFATPGGSILKRKRNGPEETTEENILPVIKKRRVNFSDPPVSSLKFIEKIIKPASCFSKHLPKELRTTRASTAEELEIENETNTEQESQSLLEIVPIEEDVEVPENSPDIETDTDTDTITTTKYENTIPICETLLDNKEPISKIVAKLTNSLYFVEPVTTILENKNIETIGDLAKLTEFQVHIIPLKVETVKSVLKEYYESLKKDTPTKEKRKITPLILSTPEKVTTEPSTCEVSVIIDNRDVISETQNKDVISETENIDVISETQNEDVISETENKDVISETQNEDVISETENKDVISETQNIDVISETQSATSPTTEEKTQQNEVFNRDFSENIFSSESERTELATANKVKTVAVVFNSPVSRMIVKTEFDSPTNAKDNILNEEYCNIRIAKFIQHIRNLFIQKKFDPRPMIASLFAYNTEILTQMNCWEDLIKYIVRDVGIWTITKYLCSLKNIPALMIESILKNSLNEIGNDFICERLNKHEIIKFLSKECNLINLLQEYDSQIVYSTFFDLANDTQYSHLKYKEMLQELYACVFQPQIEICHILYSLDVENIGDAVMKRMSALNDMDTFLDRIHKSVPLEVYLKPTKNQTKATGSRETCAETNKNSSELVTITNVVHSIDNNQFSKDEELMILRSIAKKWNALEFFQTFSQHTKQY